MLGLFDPKEKLHIACLNRIIVIHLNLLYICKANLNFTQYFEPQYAIYKLINRSMRTFFRQNLF